MPGVLCTSGRQHVYLFDLNGCPSSGADTRSVRRAAVAQSALNALSRRSEPARAECDAPHPRAPRNGPTIASSRMGCPRTSAPRAKLGRMADLPGHVRRYLFVNATTTRARGCDRRSAGYIRVIGAAPRRAKRLSRWSEISSGSPEAQRWSASDRSATKEPHCRRARRERLPRAARRQRFTVGSRQSA